MSHDLHVEDNQVYEGSHERGLMRPFLPAPEQEFNRVAGGLKASSHNPNLSKSTRQHAQEQLDDLLLQQHDADADYESDSGSKPATRSHDKKTSSASSKKKSSGKQASSGHNTRASHHQDAETTHDHRVIGGLKANLHRDDRSEATKDSIREKLRDLGEDAD
ncbi:hypothetical protein JCM8097_005574 [Rhodosporidiobolus ruineniae]